jgi:DNA polymerase delta subunit 2
VDSASLASSGTTPIRTILATSGQPLNDMCKYVPTVATTRLTLAEATLKWRHIAPTAPDTLWCHPFFTIDPFVIAETPDIYAIGCQPRFATRLVEEGKRRSRVILVPSFAQTGILVLVGLKSLDVRIVRLTDDILAHSA